MDHRLFLMVHLGYEHFRTDYVAGSDDHFTLLGDWIGLEGRQFCPSQASRHNNDHLVFLLVVIHGVFHPLETLCLLPPHSLVVVYM